MGATFEAIGAEGAIHYHVSKCELNGETHWSSGLEYHHRTPPDYMKDKPPSRDEYHLLKGMRPPDHVS